MFQQFHNEGERVVPTKDSLWCLNYLCCGREQKIARAEADLNVKIAAMRLSAHEQQYLLNALLAQIEVIRDQKIARQVPILQSILTQTENILNSEVTTAQIELYLKFTNRVANKENDLRCVCKIMFGIAVVGLLALSAGLIAGGIVAGSLAAGKIVLAAIYLLLAIALNCYDSCQFKKNKDNHLAFDNEADDNLGLKQRMTALGNGCRPQS